MSIYYAILSTLVYILRSPLKKKILKKRQEKKEMIPKDKVKIQVGRLLRI